jgi:hypothetical protein
LCRARDAVTARTAETEVLGNLSGAGGPPFLASDPQTRFLIEPGRPGPRFLIQPHPRSTSRSPIRARTHATWHRTHWVLG